MTNLKSYTVTIRIKPSRVNGPGISTGAQPYGKNYRHGLRLSVTVCKSVTENPSWINKFLVVNGHAFWRPLHSGGHAQTVHPMPLCLSTHEPRPRAIWFFILVVSHVGKVNPDEAIFFGSIPSQTSVRVVFKGLHR